MIGCGRASVAGPEIIAASCRYTSDFPAHFGKYCSTVVVIAAEARSQVCVTLAVQENRVGDSTVTPWFLQTRELGRSFRP
jgi:hypothetical protein